MAVAVQRSLAGIVSGALLLLGSCGGRPAGIEDLRAHEDLSLFKLGSIRGGRDGDRLQVQAMFSDSSSALVMRMQFVIGSPTQLESGIWQWDRNGARLEGAISARSVTFLGGQSGPPSIGGTFILLMPDGNPGYRVAIPTSELTQRPPAQ